MPKYKVGDRVAIEHMPWVEYTISKVNPDEHYYYDFEEGGSWEDSGLILVESSPPVFKIGDKVEVISNEWSGGIWDEGHVGFVYDLQEDVCRVSNSEGGQERSNTYCYEELKLVEDQPSYTFKVGDKVKCLHPTIVWHEYKDQVGEVLDVNGLESEGVITINYDGCWQAAYIKEDGVVLVEEEDDFVFPTEDDFKNECKVSYKGVDPRITFVSPDMYVEMQKVATDSVNHPSHYNESGIECIEAIEATLGPVGFQAYCKGNCMKYLWRYEYKNGLEDLKKAQVYLNWMIESMEKSDD